MIRSKLLAAAAVLALTVFAIAASPRDATAIEACPVPGVDDCTVARLPSGATVWVAFSHPKAVSDGKGGVVSKPGLGLRELTRYLIDHAADGSEVELVLHRWTSAHPAWGWDLRGDIAEAVARRVRFRTVIHDANAEGAYPVEGSNPLEGDDPNPGLLDILGPENVTRCDRGDGADPDTYGGCRSTGQQHGKFMTFSEIVDGGVRYRNVVLVTTANWSKYQTSLGNEAVVVLDDPGLYEAFDDYFERLFAMEPGGFLTGTSAKTGIGYRFFPQPRGDSLLEILDDVRCVDPTPGGDGRWPTIRFAASVWPSATSNQRVAKKLVEKLREGCDVQVSTGRVDHVSDVLLAGGVTVHHTGDGNHHHMKHLLVEAPMGDGDAAWRRIVWMGSHNPTWPSLRKNDEVLIEIENDAVFDAYDRLWRERLVPEWVEARANPEPNIRIDDNYDGTIGSLVCLALEIPGEELDEVVDAEVELGLYHSFVGHLTVKLVSPRGGVVTLLSRPGAVGAADDGADLPPGDGSNLDPTHPIVLREYGDFDAEAMGSTMGGAGVICRDDHRCVFSANPDAANPAYLSDLAGEPAAGTWKLCVGDSVPGRPAYLDQVRLRVQRFRYGPDPAGAVVTSSAKEAHTDRPHKDYKSLELPIDQPRLCEEECLRDRRCAAWTHVPAGRQGVNARCWLKSSIPAPVYAVWGTSGIKMTMEPGTDRPGSEYRTVPLLSGTGPEACRRLCLQDLPRCHAWTHAAPGVRIAFLEQCSLKSGVPGARNGEGLTSGVVGALE